MCMFHTSIKYILLHTLHVCVGTRMFGCLALVNGNDFTGVTFTSLQYLGVHWNQPRSQVLCSWEAKTLVGASHVTHRKLIAQEGDGKVSYYMFPLPHFALQLQGVAVL